MTNSCSMQSELSRGNGSVMNDFRRVGSLRMSGVPGLAVISFRDPVATFDVPLDNLCWRDGSQCSGADVTYCSLYCRSKILIAREKEGTWFIEKIEH
jgi:hypothetical protein